MPGSWVTCALGPHNFEFMTEVHREIAQRYAIDGIFSNRWAGHGVCYCDFCREEFKRESGMDLPEPEQDRTRQSLAWNQWRQKRLFRLIDLWDRTVAAARPGASFIPNSGGGALSDLDMRALGEKVPLLFADRQGRSGILPVWGNGKNIREFRAAFGEKPIGGIFCVGIDDENRWKDSVQSADEIRAWAFDGIAHGMRPWFVKFSGTVHDRRWLGPVGDVYTWHSALEPYLRGLRSAANVGVVYSQKTALLYGGNRARDTVEDHCMGMCQALIEHRVPFDMVHDDLLAPERLRSLGALVFPNIAVLSTEQCAAITAFVEQGGGVVATGETSLYDETGGRRDDFGLARLYGVHAAGMLAGPVKNSYILPNLESDLLYRDLLSGFSDAGRLIGAIHQLPVHATADFAPAPFTTVPSYPDLPMEEVYPRETSGEPALFARTYGLGRILYIPSDLDRTFWKILHADHGRLLANAIVWALGRPPDCRVAGEGVVDLAIWRGTGRYLVFLVNLNNPMLMRGSFRRSFPIGPQRIRLLLGKGETVTHVRSLRAAREIPFTISDGTMSAEVQGVKDVEAVVIEVEPAETQTLNP